MKELVFEIHSNEEIWSLVDKDLNSVFIHNFIPNEALEWWKTDLRTPKGIEFKNLKVRQLQMDVQTDLNGLKKILEHNTRQLRIYQFEKEIPNTLDVGSLAEQKKYKILEQNGLKHFFFLNFEFITIRSFKPVFIKRIETNPKFAERVADRS
jgi:hypothetical protein